MDPYEIVIEVFTNALNECGRRKVCKQEVLAPLTDFIVAIGLHLGDETTIAAIVTRMEGRIEDWRNGEFPKD
jgi:hypothetical protein